MLIHIATHQPQMLASIVQGTPSWVWYLLATLLWLGLSQTLPRQAGLRRVLFMPLALAAFSAWGLLSAFGAEPGGGALAVWLLAAGAVFLLWRLWRGAKKLFWVLFGLGMALYWSGAAGWLLR